jgi:CubicO group peptidase (beta-lactamase class C family)
MTGLAAGCAIDTADEGEIAESDVASEAIALTVSGGNAVWYSTANFAEAVTLKTLLGALRDANADIQTMASTASGEWIVVANDTVYKSQSLPSAVAPRVQQIIDAGETVRSIDFNAAGGWIAVGDTLRRSGGALPAGLTSQLQWFIEDKGWTVQDVEITDSGYLILGYGSNATYSGIDADLAAFIYDRRASKRHVEEVDIGFDGRWIAIADQEVAYEGLSSNQRDIALNRARSGRHISHFMLGSGSSYVLYSQGLVQPSPSHVMEQIEYTLPGGNLWSQLAALDVPGLSIAVIEDNAVVYARGYGLLNENEEDHVLATTPFDLASLSKYIGALTAMRLASDGDLNIDGSILNDAVPSGHVDLWNLFGSHPTVAPSIGLPGSPAIPNAMTTYHLLTHSAGLIPMGGSPRFDAAWTGFSTLDTWELMLGYDCGAISGPCGFNGNKFAWTQNGTSPVPPSYQSVNFLVAQAVAEDAGGASAADMMADFFFDPMGLADTTAVVPPPAGFLARTAWQHQAGGAPATTRAVFPWVFAGGVHASARDYAELMIIALDEGRDSQGVQRIHPFTSYAMLQGVGASGDRFGSGLRIEDGSDASEGTDRAFFHSGWHVNRAATWMCGNPTRDEGIVVLANADDGNNQVFNQLIAQILTRYANLRGWPGANCQ